MDYEWDERKNKRNTDKHGLGFEKVEFFDWKSALILEDKRKDYGEKRYRALGMIKTRLHALVFTVRGKRLRLISLRKANKREVKNYEKNEEIN